ncbi:MAG: Ig-like domain-containing protein, partial [Methanomicrobiales archaeon]|nr:Ig-like domain-containing protein [Methanomicrobiales archaeon]
MGTAAALNPVNVVVSSSNLWITADNTDSAGITVTVTDGTNKAIGGASIVLSVTQPWNLQDIVGTTPAGGQFVTGFLPTTTAGTAVITATVTVPGTTTIPVVQTYSQNITADLPTKWTKSYTSTASVGSITDITIRLTDQYGNPVSSKKKKNMVSFTTTISGENGFLVEAPSSWTDPNAKIKVKGLSIALNDSGYADVDFTLNTHPGENFVVITPPFPLPATLISIKGIADLKPAYIMETITPGGNPPTLRSDNSSRFTISYMLYDQYGNPSTNQDLSIFASSGESRVITSNNAGGVTISYGPKPQAGRYILTAQALNNPSVSVVQTVQFLSGKPANMLITANPQTMASLDVKKDMVGWVTAKVIDSNGNPVMGETVSFSMLSVKTGIYNQTQGPVIKGDKKKTDKLNDDITALTDEDGLATANFYPGTFTSDTKDAAFSPMAEGTARVRATWSGVTRDIDLSYKNFPYLSVYTAVAPSTVETNKTVDVTIRVRGDGYALQPRPVDVFMVTDRSGSMVDDYPDRMV